MKFQLINEYREIILHGCILQLLSWGAALVISLLNKNWGRDGFGLFWKYFVKIPTSALMIGHGIKFYIAPSISFYIAPSHYIQRSAIFPKMCRLLYWASIFFWTFYVLFSGWAIDLEMLAPIAFFITQLKRSPRGSDLTWK